MAVSFTHVEEAVGVHTVNLEGIRAEFTVEEKPGAFPIVVVIIPIVIVLLIAGVGAVIFIRRRARPAAAA